MDKLIIRYEPDSEDEVGKLWFDIRSENFTGSGYFWSNLTELPDIITKLRSYPLGEPAKWTWGYNNLEGSDVVLALSIAPDGHLGNLKATVEVSDLYDTSCRLTTKLNTKYNALDCLRTALEAMLTNRSGEASLLAG